MEVPFTKNDKAGQRLVSGHKIQNRPKSRCLNLNSSSSVWEGCFWGWRVGWVSRWTSGLKWFYIKQTQNLQISEWEELSNLNQNTHSNFRMRKNYRSYSKYIDLVFFFLKKTTFAITTNITMQQKVESSIFVAWRSTALEEYIGTTEMSPNRLWPCSRHYLLRSASNTLSNTLFPIHSFLLVEIHVSGSH